MEFLDLRWASAFLLVLARTTAWAMTAPGLGSRGLTPIARLAVAVGLAIFLTPLAGTDEVPDGLAAYLALVLSNTAIGLALGWLTQLVFTAVEIAGSLADLTSGFSYGQVLDPMSGAFSAAFARLMTVCFGALLFATDAYQVVLRGFAASFRSLPLVETPTLDGDGAALLAHAVTGTMVAALEIGAPLLGVLFLTDVALALASRFVPQANAMSVGIPAKALVALASAGAMLTLLPQHLERLVEPAVLLPGRIFG